MRSVALALAALLSAAAAHATDLYAFVGNTPARDLVPFENMIGRKADGLVMFNDYRLTPEAAVQNLGWGLGQQPKGYKLAVSIGLAFAQPSRDKAHQGAHLMADIGAGKLDDVYAALGATMVAHGYPTADVRLGWEENGGWYMWTAPGHEADWHAAFAHASAAIRSTCPKCRIWWNPGIHGDPGKDIPADGSYDGIGWDTYATADVGSGVEPTMWSDALNGWWGIKNEGSWPVSRLPFAVPEFGVGSRGGGKGAPDAANKPNGGDDGYWMYNALTYLVAKHAVFIGYWDFNAGDYNSKISDGSRPHEALAFLSVMGPPHVVAMLKGATLSATAIATPAGVHSLFADLPGGSKALLLWGDDRRTRRFDVVLPADMRVSTLQADGARRGGRMSMIKGYVYAGGLSVLRLEP